ncbi:MAG: hypothetical protein AB1486_13230 [Planctomycetota bacterium]
MDVTLVTCLDLPEPDPDEAPLAAALATAGIDARNRAWDDPTVDWGATPLTVLRSTWNYPLHQRAFLSWAAATSAKTRLWNPLPVVRWNAHKRYLLDLACRGVPVTPTELVQRGSRRALSAIITEHGWKEVVIKPAVSAACYRTVRIGVGSLARGEDHLRALAARGDVLVQPFVSSVEDYGERALVWIDGKLTHAVRKTPRFEGDEERVSQSVAITAAEETLVQPALAAVEGPLLYARVDAAPGDDGEPRIMELELIEPSLFFAQGPEALARFVAAISRELCRS